MPWDADKSTAADPDNPAADEQLTADEWDNHVSQGHWLSSNFELGQNGNGDPIITDPQNADEVVFRYDRSRGTWVVDSLDIDTLTITNETFVRATRASTSSSTTSGTFLNLLDGESKDKRGEFDANGNARFNADRDGEYQFTITVDLGGSTTDGDTIRIRIRDVNAGSNAGEFVEYKTTGKGRLGTVTIVRELSANTNYAVQVSNLTNDFTLRDDSTAVILRHPSG